MPSAVASSAGRWPTICATELVLDALDMAVGQRRPDRRHPSLRSRQPVHLAGLRQPLPGGRRAARRWDRSATPTTTPCARASSPRWSASCWTAAASRSQAEARMAVFSFIEGWYNPRGAIPPWATARPSPTKKDGSRRRNHPSPQRPRKRGSFTACFDPFHIGVCPVQPILAAIDTTVAQRERCSRS